MRPQLPVREGGVMPPGDYAVGKLHLPRPGSSPDLEHLRAEATAEDFQNRTIPGVGQFDCPRRDSCRLESTREIIAELKPLREEVAELRSLVLKSLTARGIIGPDTPRGKSNPEELAVGQAFKYRGRPQILWGALVAIILSVSIAAYAWMHGPSSQSVTATVKQAQ